jgi:hypothetical protein
MLFMKDCEIKYTRKLWFIYRKNIIMKNNDINIQQIRSCDNLAGFSTKLLPSRIFGQLVQKIGLHRLRDDCMVEGEK